MEELPDEELYPGMSLEVCDQPAAGLNANVPKTNAEIATVLFFISFSPFF